MNSLFSAYSPLIPNQFCVYMGIDPRPWIKPSIVYIGLTTTGIHRRWIGGIKGSDDYYGHLSERFKKSKKQDLGDVIKAGNKIRWFESLERDGIIAPHTIILYSDPRGIESLRRLQIAEIVYTRIAELMGYTVLSPFEYSGRTNSKYPHIVEEDLKHFRELTDCVLVTPEGLKDELDWLSEASQKYLGFSPIFEEYKIRRSLARNMGHEQKALALPPGKKMGYVELCVTEGCNNARRGKKDYCESCLDKTRKKAVRPTPTSEGSDGTDMAERSPPRLLRAT